MTKAATQGHIHGIPVIIIRTRDEDRTRSLREFVPLDAYHDQKLAAHAYEIGALFEAGDIGRRVVVRRMERRPMFTDEHLVEMMGEARAREYLENERRGQPRRRGIMRARARMKVPVLAPDKCDVCEVTGTLIVERFGRVCTRCNTAMVMAGDSPELLRKLAGYLERLHERTRTVRFLSNIPGMRLFALASLLVSPAANLPRPSRRSRASAKKRGPRTPRRASRRAIGCRRPKR